MRYFSALGLIAVLATPAMALELVTDADPVAREIISACSRAITTRVVPMDDGWRASEAKGWELTDRAPGDWHYADNDVAGIGLLHLSLIFDQINGDDIGSCRVDISDAGRTLPVGDFGTADRLAGAVGDPVSTWFRDDNKLKIIVVQSAPTKSFSFVLDVFTDAGV